MAKLKKEIGAYIQGYVLDLRNNPGGLLDQAVAVSNAFLNKGEIVSTRSNKAEDTQRFNARRGDLADNLPIVVLVNGGSASASEIVAGALQDHRRAVILGTKSFGKGSVQTIIPLPGHGAMRLTTARYYTPSGRSIQAKGIDPDILVQQSRIEKVDAPKGRFESDLRNALDNGDNKDSKKKTEKPDAAKPKDDKAEAPLDFQLARALDLLRGVALFGDRAVKTN
jgi:carboxyl-terminal processing protease